MKRILAITIFAVTAQTALSAPYTPAPGNDIPVMIAESRLDDIHDIEGEELKFTVTETGSAGISDLYYGYGMDAGEIYLHPETDTYDSLITRWYEQNVVDSYDRFFREYIDLDTTEVFSSDIPDSVYISRLKLMVSPINLGYNDIVKRYIDVYTKNKTGTISRVLGLSRYYFPMIEEELANANLPIELRMLPVIESALNPTAVSRAGATGLWQFMYGTGRNYGLQITSYIDERMDPVLSTKAACRFLQDLYKMYGDWTLALAAYNCGPGNVNKAIRRAGSGARTYWDIYPYLPKETRGYIPAFIAATYAYTFYQKHDIVFTEPPLPISTDTVMIDRLMHLGQVASTIDIPIETLKALNPQYKADIVPAVERTYPLTLPQSKVGSYIDLTQEIAAKDSVYLASFYQNPGSTLKDVATTASVTHSVKSGDTLGAIARKYGVTVSQLVRWNNLKSANSILRIGQRIEIHK